MFSREWSFSIPTAKVVHLECFAVYGNFSKMASQVSDQLYDMPTANQPMLKKINVFGRIFVARRLNKLGGTNLYHSVSFPPS